MRLRIFMSPKYSVSLWGFFRFSTTSRGIGIHLGKRDLFVYLIPLRG